MPFTLLTQGTFTQPSTGAVAQYIPLPSGVDYFVTTNYTQMATTQSTGVCVRGEWFGGGITNAADGISWVKGNSNNNLTINTFAGLSSTGFTYYTSYPAPGPAVTGTSISQASSAVVSMTNTFANGNRVVLYNTTGMLQISGMIFTISSVSGSQFTLSGLNSSGFAAAASAVTARLLPATDPAEPRALFVTGITQATNAVVTCSETVPYVVGMKVIFQVPASFGMTQIDNFNQSQSKPIVITAVSGNTFTINLNTTSYSAFAFPASSGSPTTQLFATVAPQGQSTQVNAITGVQTGYNFQEPPYRNGFFIPQMYIPAGAQTPGGSASDVIVYQAYKMETATIGGNGT